MTRPALNELLDEIKKAITKAESIAEGPKQIKVTFEEGATDSEKAQTLRQVADWLDTPAE